MDKQLDILFDNTSISEIIGINGTANDVLFDRNILNEIPNPSMQCLPQQLFVLFCRKDSFQDL